MTITRRILLQIAVATSLVILVVSGVTYGLVYRSAEQRELNHLRDYVSERALVEETKLVQVRENLYLVRTLYLRRLSLPPPPDFLEQWDHWFSHDADGAWRSRREFSDGRQWATSWIGRGADLTPEVRTQILHAHLLSNDLLPTWVDTFTSLYFIFPCQANIGFDPRLPNWVWDTPADYDNNGIEAIAAARPAENPSRKIIWSGVFEEQTTKVPSITVALPIDKDGQHIATVGHDIVAMDLLDDSTRSSLRGVTHVIFHENGLLIAHREKMPQILAAHGQYTMQSSDDPMLRSLYAATRQMPGRLATGYDPTSRCYYAVSRLADTGWLFLSTMPRAVLREQAFASARWVLWSGLPSLALVLAFFAVILRRQIEQPLAELARATGEMSQGEPSARADVRRRDELGALANSFNTMATRVASRDAELRELNADLERQVAARTAELTEALAAESELNAMKGSFISMVSHEFRTPLSVIVSAADVLDRYLDRLLPEERREHLAMIFRSAENLTRLVENVLLLGKVEGGRLACKPAPINLDNLLHQLADEINSATNARCPILCEADLPAGAQADADLLRHILGNLLSNAVKYSEAGSPVSVRIRARGADAVFAVQDRGIGIPEEDAKALFSSFSRGGNVGERPGSGLGLLIVKRCAELHGGRIQIQSAPGQGTTATVTLPDIFPAS